MVEHNKQLKAFNTFGVEAVADYFIDITSTDQLRRLLNDDEYGTIPRQIIGGGSNLLFVGDYPGLIMHIDITGFEKIDEDDKYIYLQVGAGENWHETVRKAVDKGWGGIENLALIPGTAGAAPIQNIGAYGVELADVFVSLKAFNLETLEVEEFGREACEFDYRESIFKNKLKNKAVVIELVLRLTKEQHHSVDISYSALKSFLKRENIERPSIQQIFNAVTTIRQSKLPDPEKTGNAGSFFKNPIIGEEHYFRLKEAYPDLPSYQVDNKSIKIPAAWLIDRAGWKGVRRGDAGTYEKQALVIVNHGNANGQQIVSLAREIRQSVNQKFGISLEPEVNIISGNGSVTI